MIEFIYYGHITAGRTPKSPAGVVRRSTVDGYTVDEVFSRNLQWEPTTALLGQRFGHGSGEYVEISAAEAERFVERVTQKLRGTG